MRKWPAVISVVLFAAVATAASFFPASAADDIALEIVLSPRSHEARTGEAVGIDVTVTNPSSDTATGIEITFEVDGLAAIELEGCMEPWAGVSCSLGDIPPTETRSVVLSGIVAVPGSVTAEGTVISGEVVSTGGASIDASGPACTLVGTLAADVLQGTPNADVICAGPGDDRIEARAGNDRVFAGGGSDLILAGWGDDRIDGDGGPDTLVFDQGSGVVVDVATGRSNGGGRKRFASIEVVRGTAGDDFLLGSRSGEILDGRAGHDKIVGRRGPDALIGGSGEDDLSGGPGRDHLDGGTGVDTCLKGPVFARCERRWRPLALAGAVGLEVFLPGRRIEGVGFHESLFSTAAAMTSRSDAFFVMSSRGRGTPATSAADVVMRSGAKVLAPVSGKVVSVTPYRLYCGSESDVRILIKPRGRPDIRVMVLHVRDVRVHAGQRLWYAYTVLGTPRSFASFADQVDRYVPGGHPHVHVEVESPASSPLPGC
ncbi:MAG: hypothetical protein GEU71_04175 [Actinobacteria bacterium]|nr:hypothetical protein [Actinomycetota bacterium]